MPARISVYRSKRIMARCREICLSKSTCRDSLRLSDMRLFDAYLISALELRFAPIAESIETTGDYVLLLASKIHDISLENMNATASVAFNAILSAVPPEDQRLAKILFGNPADNPWFLSDLKSELINAAIEIIQK